MKKEQYWEDYWQSDGQAGEVLLNSGGDKPRYLVEFWQDLFRGLDSCEVYDLACGAGSIYESLGSSIRTDFELFGVDVSGEALEILKQRMPEVQAIRSRSQGLPFEDQSLGYCVSQFGIEYAGIDGFREVARVLKKGGRATFLCHIENGYIDRRNKKYLDGANLVVSSNYIDTAKNLTRALFKADQSEIERCKAEFEKSEALLSKEIGSNVNGIHEHIFHGFRQLLQRYSAYYESDIVGWLVANEADVEKNIAKVSNIKDVSLNQDKKDVIEQIFREAGFSEIKFEDFYGHQDSKLPVAVKLQLHN